MEMEFVVLTWRKGTIRIYVELSCWNDNSTTLCESSRINEETGNGKVRWHESYRPVNMYRLLSRMNKNGWTLVQ